MLLRFNFYGHWFNFNTVNYLTRLSFILILFPSFIFSQETVQIYFIKFGSFKKYEIHSGETLEYKLKGDIKFRKDRITSLRDSIIFFESDNEVKLNQLKCIRFQKNNFVITKFRKFFLRAGIGFLILDSFNNLILNRPTIVNEKAVIVSAALFTTGLLLKRMSYKKLRLNKHKTLKIVNFNYENVNIIGL